MLLSQPNMRSGNTGSDNTGPDMKSGSGLLMRLVLLIRTSLLKAGAIVFAVLAAIGTFFFAMAAIIGTLVLAGAIAIVWFLFRWQGAKKFANKRAGSMDTEPMSETILDARRGPKGWTVNGCKRFDR